MSDRPRDQLFDDPDAPDADFVFDEPVVRVFADMIDRSVPCYRELVRLNGIIAARYCEPGALVYDLGCSLGATTASLMAHAGHKRPTVIAVDNSQAMIDGLCSRLPDAVADGSLRPMVADIAAVEIRDARLVMLNLTLQFIPLAQRGDLLQRIYAGLNPGGALLLAEKVDWPESDISELMSSLHLDMKRANGYSELEISRKRAALERVLIPEDIETHEKRLHHAGFRRVERWFQCLNFVGWIAWS